MIVERLLGQRVRKTGGSFQHTGVVVAEFETTAQERRIVLEFDAPVKGMLHVYRPDQVEVLPPPAPDACPYASFPFRYCERCCVSPCPLGLGK